MSSHDDVGTTSAIVPVEDEQPPRVKLVCVSEGSKLRVKIRGAGYPAHVNCQFPRHLRFANATYLVPESNIRLVYSGNRKAFYRVSAENIVAIDTDEGASTGKATLSADQVFNVTDDGTCVICYDNPCDVAVAPCGHVFMCAQCATKISTKCSICRTPIQSFILVNEIA
jgi:hypothetical protein